MQICNCLVRLNGDPRHTVPKTGISVAEIAVLEAIHGSGSVTDIQPVKNDKREHKGELERLMRTYSPNGLTERGDVVRRLFPGLNPQLPKTLEEIGKTKPKVASKNTKKQADDKDPLE